MSGRHEQSATGGRVRLGLAGLGLALVAVLIAAFAGPADASSKTIHAQLSLSGLASADNPVGGSLIGVRPGDKVTFSAAGVPTAGLDKLGIGGLVGGLLNAGATFQVTADFSALPGGRADTVLSGAATKTFTFPRKGTFAFTWTAQSVTVTTVPVLGTKKTVTPISLDGNQLAKAGVKLNADNSYVGRVVVATNPPPGGLSIQVPTVRVAPSAPVVGQLPTLTIPGVNLPTVHVTVPDLNPGSLLPQPGKTTGGTKATAPPAAAPTTNLSFQPPGVNVPQMVVPGAGGGGAGGGGAYAGSAGGGGFRIGVAGAGSQGSSTLTVGNDGSGSGAAGATTGTASDNGSGSSQPVDLASSASSPSGQLPVLLAILAVITLAMVAGIYARLYLLGRKSAAS